MNELLNNLIFKLDFFFMLLLMLMFNSLTLFSEGVGVTGLEFLDLVDGDGEGGGGGTGGVICWLLLTV